MENKENDDAYNLYEAVKNSPNADNYIKMRAQADEFKTEVQKMYHKCLQMRFNLAREKFDLFQLKVLTEEIAMKIEKYEQIAANAREGTDGHNEE